MKSTKNKRGGVRPGSGRNKIAAEDRKRPITIWVEGNKITSMGGDKALKLLLKGMVDNAYNMIVTAPIEERQEKRQSLIDFYNSMKE